MEQSPETARGYGISLLPTLHRGNVTGGLDSVVFLEPSNISQGPSNHVANPELQLMTVGQISSIQNLTPKAPLN